MARNEIDSFEIGRRALAIPFRELPIWLACAIWPFAAAVLLELSRRGTVTLADWALEPVSWIADAIFSWCWMTALCRSTVLQLVTFPVAPGFWLFLILNLGLELVWWGFSAILGIVGVAAYAGYIPFLDWDGIAIQLIGLLLTLSLVVLSIWVSLRLAIWPAHCVATGRLVKPSAIWRGMRDHSFDMLVIGVITIGPILLFIGAIALMGEIRDLAKTGALQLGATVLRTYIAGAFDAAMLIAYFGIFAGVKASDWTR